MSCQVISRDLKNSQAIQHHLQIEQPATLNIKARKLCIPEVCCNMACRDHYNAADPLIFAIIAITYNEKCKDLRSER